MSTENQTVENSSTITAATPCHESMAVLKELFNQVDIHQLVSIEHELVTNYLRQCIIDDHEWNEKYLHWVSTVNGLFIGAILRLEPLMRKHYEQQS